MRIKGGSAVYLVAAPTRRLVDVRRTYSSGGKSDGGAHINLSLRDPIRLTQAVDACRRNRPTIARRVSATQLIGQSRRAARVRTVADAW